VWILRGDLGRLVGNDWLPKESEELLEEWELIVSGVTIAAGINVDMTLEMKYGKKKGECWGLRAYILV